MTVQELIDRVSESLVEHNEYLAVFADDYGLTMEQARFAEQWFIEERLGENWNAVEALTDDDLRTIFVELFDDGHDYSPFDRTALLAGLGG